ncbi:MAG: hypothetical protein ACP5IB_03625 [Thermoplasmata archaeon]
MKYLILLISVVLISSISSAGNINIGINGLNSLIYNNQKIIEFIHFYPNPYGVWINDSNIYEYSNGYVDMQIVPLPGPMILMHFNGSGRSVMKFFDYVYKDITFNGFQDNNSLIYGRCVGVNINVSKNYVNVSWYHNASMVLIINPNLDFNKNTNLLFTPYNISITVVYNGITLSYPTSDVKLNGTYIMYNKNRPILLYSNININKFYIDNTNKVLNLKESNYGYYALINIENNNGIDYNCSILSLILIIIVSSLIYRVGRK